MNFLQKIFGPKATPLTPEQVHSNFITDTVRFFDLPWDGRQRLEQASAQAIIDIKDIREHSERDYEDSMPYYHGVPMRVAHLFWQNRVKHTALVMEKLGYSEDDVATRKTALMLKHRTHFHPRTFDHMRTGASIEA